MSSEAHDKITRAKVKMVNRQPFYAIIALGLPFIEAPWLNPPTMATDMLNIYYHPKFVEEHSAAEIEAVIAHEVLHVANLHGTRRGTRNPLIWNIACDFAINLVVRDSGYTLPKDALLDEKYKDMSAGEIYELLMKEVDKLMKQFKLPGMSGGGQGDEEGEGDGGGQGEGQQVIHGGVFDPGSFGDQSANGGTKFDGSTGNLEQEVKIKVKKAADAAKSRGKMPGGLEGLIEAVQAPKIDWKEYIQNWVKGHTPDDYTWAKPRRTMLANHRIYMPSMVLNGAGIGILSIDTSGSVSDAELVQYVSEIVGMIEMCKPEKLYIIQHDAIVQKIDVWEHGMDFKNLKVKGRGGTCIMPVFQHIKDQIEETIDWMICFTDMGICDYPPETFRPDCPVLWAATGPMNAPFGQYIPLRDAMDR